MAGKKDGDRGHGSRTPENCEREGILREMLLGKGRVIRKEIMMKERVAGKRDGDRGHGSREQWRGEKVKEQERAKTQG